MAEDYVKIQLIGAGTFGQAWLAKKKEGNKRCVIKDVKVSGLTAKERNQALTEVSVLARCKHINVIRYKDAFVDNGALHIVMEYADGGDLHKKIKAQHGEFLLEKVVLQWFVQICFALQYIHGQKILHRDLKTQNIFLTSNNLIKVGDFGISRVLENTHDKALTAVGTPYYLSPEICDRKPYNNKSDLWSLGCILYEMACLRLPFDATNFNALVFQIMRATFTPVPSHYTALVDDLVRVLLRVDPEQRPGADQVLRIPALQPTINTYVQRMQVAREQHQQQSPSRHVAGRDRARVRAHSSVDKENVNPQVGKVAREKECHQGRSSPRRSPLCQQQGQNCSSPKVTSADKKSCDSPKMTLYKEVLTRKPVTPTTPTPRRSQSRSPAPGSPSAGGSGSGSPGKARYVPPPSSSPLAKFLRHSPLSEERQTRAPQSPPPGGHHVSTPPAPMATFVVVAADVPRPTSAEVRSDDDPRGLGAMTTPHPASDTDSILAEADRKRKQQDDVDGKEPGSAKKLHNGERTQGGPRGSGLSDQAIYRQLYASAIASPASAASNIETLRCCLEDQMGAAKFAAIYANMTVAVKNGLSFDGLGGFIRDGDMWRLFPLLIQLVQMESVANVANQSCA